MPSTSLSYPCRSWFLALTAIFALAAVGSLTAQSPQPVRRLPVYTVSKSGLSADEGTRLQKAFGLKQIAVDEAGVARYLDQDGFLKVPTLAVDAQTAKREGGEDGKALFERFDLDALRRLKAPDRKYALDSADKSLRAAKVYPADAAATATATRFELVDAKGQSLADQALDMAVSYRFTLAGLPLEGPGAKVRVAYGSAGEVTQLIYATRQFVQAGLVAVIAEPEGRKRCAQWSNGEDGQARKVMAADLAYYAPALSEKVERLAPSFRCRLQGASGAVSQVFFVPAAVDAKRPPRPEPQAPRPAALAQAAARSVTRVDVGSEGTGPCSGLPNTGTNVAGFNNRMSADGVPVQFSWLDANAWEDDWKDPSLSGHDSDWVDDVDMAYWQGHGWPFGYSFSGCSSIDDASLVNTDARWGDRDAEWISLFTCLVLAEEDGGQRWWQRWGPAFQGLHQINSFHTVSYHSSQHGGIYANYLVRTPFLWWNNPLKVREAWAQAAIDDQPDSVVWASMGPVGPGGLVNYNDYFWGKGPVGPDVAPAQITGFWRLSGGS
jgi:hypothetical protein